jgi:hypothetical protein
MVSSVLRQRRIRDHLAGHRRLAARQVVHPAALVLSDELSKTGPVMGGTRPYRAPLPCQFDCRLQHIAKAH